MGEEQMKMQQMAVEAQAQQTITGLSEAAITQRTMLEEKAAISVMDYQKKKAIEEMAMKSYQVQKQYYEQEMKLMQQYGQVARKGAGAVVTPGMVAPASMAL